jgi:hypothetical protein
MVFSPALEALLCDYCGSASVLGSVDEQEEPAPPLSPALRSEKAHAWLSGCQEAACENCGAHSLLTAGEASRPCPYCGSSQQIISQALTALIEPQRIGLIAVDQAQAEAAVTNWLGSGFFAPDDLSDQASAVELRPGYYPFWIFAGALEMKWSCEVRDSYALSTRNSPEWQSVQGTAVELFDDILVPGVRALDPSVLLQILPFDLHLLIEFSPHHLAGWQALAYDRSLSDASLVAREQVVRQERPRIEQQIAPGTVKRSVRFGGTKWMGVTYQLVLLPIWAGTYAYLGKVYPIMVNGQTGQVAGLRPRDKVKIGGILAMSVTLAVLLLLVWLIVHRGEVLF